MKWVHVISCFPMEKKVCKVFAVNILAFKKHVVFLNYLKEENQNNITCLSNWIWAWKATQTSMQQLLWRFEENNISSLLLHILLLLLALISSKIYQEFYYRNPITILKFTELHRKLCVIYGDELEGLNYLHECFR